jgi:hypothetical protein
MKHRLKALEAKVAQDGLILTEAQLAALEKPIKADGAIFQGVAEFRMSGAGTIPEVLRTWPVRGKLARLGHTPLLAARISSFTFCR